MGATFSRVKNWTSGETLTASDLNSEFNNILNNLDPSGIDDESANDAAAQATSDPYPGSSLSKATSLQEEIQQLRYLIAQITGETYWYIDPDINLTTIGGDNWVTAAKLTTDSVETAKIKDANVTAAKLEGAIPETGGGSLKVKVIEIGDWNMDTTASVNVAHGLTLANIRQITVLIRHDLDEEYYPLDYGGYSTSDYVDGSFMATPTNVELSRREGGMFDGVNYNATSFNRGWVTIWYTI